jgi:serine/threonine-protein kinase/endoribonuclease IRE1
LDAATGRVLKWFGSTGSQINEVESCLKPNALVDLDGECSDTGAITLGRTEYTVGIHHSDGRPIATLKYSEWGPNTFDNDLFQQYRETLDNWYITSQHDGRFYGFNYGRNKGSSPLFARDLPAPIAKVFDVARPSGAPPGSNPELIILPQPPLPDADSEERNNGVFLNQTVEGGWYAMSGNAYPLILDAPAAMINSKDWWDAQPSWDMMDEHQITKALVGTHFVNNRGQGAWRLRPPVRTLPEGPISHVSGAQDQENDSDAPTVPASSPPSEPSTLLTQARNLPELAAAKVKELFTNPILVLIGLFLLFYYQKELRRWYNGSDAEPPVASPVDSPSVESSPEPPPASAYDAIPVENEVVTPLDHETVPLAADSNEEEPAPEMTPSTPVDSSDKEGSPVVTFAKPPHEPASAESGKKKKAHRGRRGGVKHKKIKDARELSQSGDDDLPQATVDEVVNNAKKLGEQPKLEPDILTVTNDMAEISGPILKMGSLEVNEDQQLGTGSNGTVVFSGKWDGRDVAVKRMLIQFNEIACQETRLLRESDDHPNGTSFLPTGSLFSRVY